MRKLWGGAFSEEPNDLAWAFGQSIESDSVLWLEELEVSIAHAKMLGATGIVSDVSAIVSALSSMAESASWLEKHVDAEDIHAAVEAELESRIGVDAKRLTTARSRNDQIATVSRVWVARRCGELVQAARSVQETLLELAEKHAADALPGYTHMQPAQPVTLGFHLLAYVWMLQRDKQRFAAGKGMAMKHCPLGSGALAGTSLPIDRETTAKALGFETASPNAMDSVSDRDFIGDALHACAMCMQHLSRLSQEIVLWATAEYGYVKVGDAFSTGSSLMPQKRNPDTGELIRGRAAQTIGNWVSFMSMMKGLPMAYNRDMQDDKPPLFASAGLCLDSLKLMAGMLKSLTFNTERMADMTAVGSQTATRLAEHFVKVGMPFRTAHEEAGRVVLECEKKGWNLARLTMEQLGSMTDKASEELLAAISISTGGTPMPPDLARQIEAAKASI